MITAKKLLSLKERTRIRKAALILQEGAKRIKTGQDPDIVYLNTIIPVVGLETIDSSTDKTHIMFRLEDYAHCLLTKLGAEPSDWDFVDDYGSLDTSKRIVQDKMLVLDRLRSPFNVGAVFRSADSFGIKKIILIEGTANPLHPRSRRTSRGCTQTVEWAFMTEDETVKMLRGYPDGKVIALETGGSDINTFSFPDSGVFVLGSEELGVSPEILSCCTARVSIPMAGTKGSLNVSVAAGIMMQRWFAASAS